MKQTNHITSRESRFSKPETTEVTANETPLGLFAWRRLIPERMMVHLQWGYLVCECSALLLPQKYQQVESGHSIHTDEQAPRRDSPWCSAAASPSSRWPASHTPASGWNQSRHTNGEKLVRFLCEFKRLGGEKVWRCIISTSQKNRHLMSVSCEKRLV